MSRFMKNDELLGKVPMYNNDFYIFKVVRKTKKEHQCSYCNEIIPAGNTCDKHVGSSGMQFFCYYSHFGDCG